MYGKYLVRNKNLKKNKIAKLIDTTEVTRCTVKEILRVFD